MPLFIFVLTAINGPIVGLAVFAIIVCVVVKLMRKTKKKTAQAAEPELDDVSYIQEMKHQSIMEASMFSWSMSWQQYDVLLAARSYGWEYMVNWADYMENADFDCIDSIIVSAPGEQDIDLAHIYNKNKVGLENFDRLAKEMASLSVAGHSRTLNGLVKIVWYNQTRVLRVYSHIKDETLITKYVETLIRRTFGTPDAMKLAKPVPQEATNPNDVSPCKS